MLRSLKRISIRFSLQGLPNTEAFVATVAGDPDRVLLSTEMPGVFARSVLVCFPFDCQRPHYSCPLRRYASLSSRFYR
jgi:hypothetical protein